MKNNKTLYESIMKDISKTIKRYLNEYDYGELTGYYDLSDLSELTDEQISKICNGILDTDFEIFLANDEDYAHKKPLHCIVIPDCDNTLELQALDDYEINMEFDISAVFETIDELDEDEEYSYVVINNFDITNLVLCSCDKNSNNIIYIEDDDIINKLINKLVNTNFI